MHWLLEWSSPRYQLDSPSSGLFLNITIKILFLWSFLKNCNLNPSLHFLSFSSWCPFLPTSCSTYFPNFFLFIFPHKNVPFMRVMVGSILFLFSTLSPATHYCQVLCRLLINICWMNWSIYGQWANFALLYLFKFILWIILMLYPTINFFLRCEKVFWDEFHYYGCILLFFFLQSLMIEILLYWKMKYFSFFLILKMNGSLKKSCFLKMK